jgi:hypothetical protein
MFLLCVCHPSWRFNTGFFLKEMIRHSQLPLTLILFQNYQAFTLFKEKAFPSDYVEPILLLDMKSLLMAS